MVDGRGRRTLSSHREKKEDGQKGDGPSERHQQEDQKGIRDTEERKDMRRYRTLWREVGDIEARKDIANTFAMFYEHLHSSKNSARKS